MKKVGIVTFYNAYNYGAFFQQYALQQFLLSQGFDADIINYTSKFISDNSLHSMNIFKGRNMMKAAAIIYMFFFQHREWRDKLRWQKKFADCIKNELKVSEPFSYDKKERFNKQYDCFIAGSDQVWNTALTGDDDFYFLDFAESPDKKKTYAVSLGFSQWQTGQADIYKDKLKDYKHVLIREKSGKELLKGLGIEADTVLDPTLLTDRKQWYAFSQKSRLRLPEKYIMLYIVQTPTDLIPLAKKYAAENNCELILICASNRNITLESGTLKATINITPYDFINYMLHAQAVFTTSFHGMILSVYLNRNFYYELLRSKENRNTRLEYMADIFELHGREIKNGTLPENDINWDKVNKRIDELQKYSRDKLLSSLRQN